MFECNRFLPGVCATSPGGGRFFYRGDKVADRDNILRLTREVADRYSLDSGEMRPCVARMLTRHENENGLAKEPIAFMVAVDLKRMGVERERRREILVDSCIAGVNPINRAVRSSMDEKYKTWACSSNTMHGDREIAREYFCVGHDQCVWYMRNEGKGKNKFKPAEDRNFEGYGWHHVCTAYEYIIYQQLRELERLKGYGAGDTIIVSHDRLAFDSGCDIKTIGNNLRSMAEKGIIEYTPGKRTKDEISGSKISRILPVPEPAPKYENKLKSFQHFLRHNRMKR